MTTKPQQEAAKAEAAPAPQENGEPDATAIPVLEDVLETAEPETGPDEEKTEEEPEIPPLPLSTLDDAQLQTLMQNLAYKLEQQITSLATVVRINFMRELREQFQAIAQKRSEAQETTETNEAHEADNANETHETHEASADKTIPPGSAAPAGQEEPQ